MPAAPVNAGGTGRVAPKGVAAAVLGHPQPVHPPHVLTPPDHLAHETFDRTQRSAAVAIGGLGRLDDLVGVQQADVHRRRQHRVGQLPLGGEHGVLVRSERRQAVVDELTQSGQRLGAGDRPGAVGICAERGRGKSFDHRAVDVVELEQGDRRPGSTVARWRFTVVVVEVPPTADRLGAVGAIVDEHAEAQSLPSVEVLHRQPLAVGRPAREVLVVAEEMVIAHQLDAEGLHRRSRIPARRLHGDHRADTELIEVVAQPLVQCGGSAMVDVEPFGTQLGGEVGHGRQHEVEPLTMPPTRGDQCCALDEQHTTVTGHRSASAPLERQSWSPSTHTVGTDGAVIVAV